MKILADENLFEPIIAYLESHGHQVIRCRSPELSGASDATEMPSGSETIRREREAESLFVFGHLLREVDPGGFLRDPAQIGIEFPVPQLVAGATGAITSRSSCKRQVCKGHCNLA